MIAVTYITVIGDRWGHIFGSINDHRNEGKDEDHAPRRGRNKRQDSGCNEYGSHTRKSVEYDPRKTKSKQDDLNSWRYVASRRQYAVNSSKQTWTAFLRTAPVDSDLVDVSFQSTQFKVDVNSFSAYSYCRRCPVYCQFVRCFLSDMYDLLFDVRCMNYFLRITHVLLFTFD